MERPLAFMLSGQGSHYYQMGRELFNGNAVFQRSMIEMDAIAQRVLGRSILDTIYFEGRRKDEVFDQTASTNAAIFMVECALAQSLSADGVVPDTIVSTSLGIFPAAVIAGAIDVKDGLEAVSRLGLALDATCERGAMVALLADEHSFSELPAVSLHAELAARNLPGHFVVSMAHSNVEPLLSALSAENIMFSKLAVSHAFHSRWIDPVKEVAMAIFSEIRYRPPEKAIVCCSDGREITSLRPYDLWSALRMPIDFSSTIKRLEQRAPHFYVDLGPTGTLAGFLRRGVLADDASRVSQVLTPFGSGAKNYERLKDRAQGTLATLGNDGPRVDLGINVSANPAPAIERIRSDQDVFVFPGQGSQVRGMGKGLFDEIAEFYTHEREIDALLGYSARKLCLEDPDDELRNTNFTQPNLYIVNALHFFKALQDGCRPAGLLGHSLGEYNALLGAGVFDFMTGLRIVQKRGELMAQAENGGMAAVVGLNPAVVEDILARESLTSLDVASYNSPAQMVISGPREDITRAVEIMERAGAKFCMPLPVSAAFHSRYMTTAADSFKRFLQQFNFAPPQVPVVSNVSAEFYGANDPRPLLVQQIVSPVRWVESIRFMAARGAVSFREIGPGSVLTNLIRDIRAAPGMVLA